ncbi:PREDICTED: delta-like protein 1 [Priapulus caudatus]|uniref:Delta-like protein 1 n=1 Tax=Priapulus caudatus TaxID=37621 RepID=A0ABM1EMB8_PRICU|nr:PREDICTED: delta-like protein 1 [Priapulus caudatus]
MLSLYSGEWMWISQSNYVLGDDGLLSPVTGCSNNCEEEGVMCLIGSYALGPEFRECKDRGDYMCEMTPETWSIEFDNCCSTPCLHGGTCTEVVGPDPLYTCDCTDTGYTGLQCEKGRRCPTTPKLSHARVRKTGRIMDSTALITCHTGYETKETSSMTAICHLSDGTMQWVPLTSDCTIIHCPTLSTDEHAACSKCPKPDPTYLTKLTHACEDGYYYAPTKEKTKAFVCSADKTWQPNYVPCDVSYALCLDRTFMAYVEDNIDTSYKGSTFLITDHEGYGVRRLQPLREVIM